MTSSLLDSRLGDIVKDQWLVTLEPNDNLAHGLEKLAQNHILCAPVVDTTSRSTPTILGFVDVLDVLHFLVRQCTKLLVDTQTGESRSLTSDDIAMMRKRTKDFKMAHVVDVINASKKDPSYTMNLNSTCRDAINSYLKGVHRIAVIDENGVPLGLVSQCGILEKILERKDELLKQMAQVKVKDSPFVSENVVCVHKDQITLNALIIMQTRNLGDIGIVDNNNKLIGVLSASDLKNLVEGDFQKLLEPVSKFVGDIRRNQGKREDFCVVGTKEDDIALIMRKMVENKVHRVFIVDNQFKPVGVVSMTDIMRGSIKGAPTTA